MIKGSARKIALLLLALTLLFAAACNSGGTDIEIDLPENTQPPFAPDQLPGESDAPTPLPEDSAAPTPVPTPTSAIDPGTLDGTAEVKEEPKLSYDEYRALNADVVGWIKIGNTNIDYPVVKGTDNEYYLTHSVKKASSAAGTIFVDYRCSPGDGHVILHGHNMSKSKIMFAQLSNYGNKSFYEKNRTFKVTFGDKEYTYKVFAVYSVDVNDAAYMKVDKNFSDEASLADFINTLAAKSIYAVDTTIAAGDRVLTLSTCTHTNYKNGRYVVHAVRVG